MTHLKSCFCKKIKVCFDVGASISFHKFQRPLCEKNYFARFYYCSSVSGNSQINKIKHKMSECIYPNETPIKLLDCEKAFNNLTNKEKLYAHYLSKACFYGGLIVLSQTSLESSLIFALLHKLFKAQSINELKEIALQKCNFNQEEFIAVLVYAAGLFSNMGNYKGDGDKKFVPNLSKEKFESLVMESKASKLEPEKLKYLLSQCLEPMFSLEDHEKQLGFPYIGKTTYLSKNFTEEDQDIVGDFIKKMGFEPTNSRLIKTIENNGTACYEIRLASVLLTDDEEEKNILLTHMVNGHKFIVSRGDYSELLNIVNKYLAFAKEYSANENEVKMIENYIQSFHTGSIEKHKEGSRYWIRDKGPIIETYIGFIETHRDPAGIRAEFEGFVAMVNRSMSVKFTNLVNAAIQFLPLLPWPPEYEKDKFLCPDFTSLDILSFAGSMIPIGICIPNYEDIRQYEGFKNVSLGNVITSRSVENANFLCKEDQELYENYLTDSCEILVGLHELLGHGSGKLFKKNKDGELNFDTNKIKHLETGEKINKYYEAGETYDSVFSSLASPFEECRAESVALFLCPDPDILKIFGHEGSKAEKVLSCSWLSTLYSGLQGLKNYEPKTQSWLQAHSQAYYAILQVCLEAGEDFVNIQQIKGTDGKPDLLLTVDFNKIKTVGKKAIGNFLRKLQLYKATADYASAKSMFEKYSAVNSEDKYPFLNYREIVLARRKPRDILVQANTVVKGEDVHLINYESSLNGLIQSWMDRFQEENVEEILEDMWKRDKAYF